MQPHAKQHRPTHRRGVHHRWMHLAAACALVLAAPLLQTSQALSGHFPLRGESPSRAASDTLVDSSGMTALRDSQTAQSVHAVSVAVDRGAPRRIEVDGPKRHEVWTASAMADHDLPAAAARAYRHAARVMTRVDPACQIPWTLLAAIGRVESNHGQYGGAVLASDGVSHPTILGVQLNGAGPVAAIFDTDDGRLDSDTVWDRAVGPMQFIPSTWAGVAKDGDGDGISSPNDLDDAALAAAAYLCGGSGSVRNPVGMAAAIYRYNPSDAYVQLVMAFERGYRTGAFSLTPSPAYPDTQPLHPEDAVQEFAPDAAPGAGPDAAPESGPDAAPHGAPDAATNDATNDGREPEAGSSEPPAPSAAPSAAPSSDASPTAGAAPTPSTTASARPTQPAPTPAGTPSASASPSPTPSEPPSESTASEPTPSEPPSESTASEPTASDSPSESPTLSEPPVPAESPSPIELDEVTGQFQQCAEGESADAAEGHEWCLDEIPLLLGPIAADGAGNGEEDGAAPTGDEQGAAEHPTQAVAATLDEGMTAAADFDGDGAVESNGDELAGLVDLDEVTLGVASVEDTDGADGAEGADHAQDTDGTDGTGGTEGTEGMVVYLINGLVYRLDDGTLASSVGEKCEDSSAPEDCEDTAATP